MLAIAGILLGIGVPSFARLVKTMRIEANTNQFVMALASARAEALRSGRTVSISATAATAGNEWGKGLSVTRTGTVAAVQTVEAFQTTTFDSVGNDSTYVFNAGGMLDGTDTINVCDDRTGETGREITILATGIVDVQTLVCP